MIRATLVLAALVAVVTSSGAGRAASGSSERIDAFHFGDKPARVDGLLKEWPQLQALAQRLQGNTGASASGLVGYDAEFLYVAMEVKDPDFRRTRAFANSEDHAILELAVPLASGGFKQYTLRFFAGDSGKTAGVVKLDGVGALKTAELVEAPDRDGYAFEARLPWAALSAAKLSRSGIRARLVYNDRSKGKSARFATSKASGTQMPIMTLEAEYALFRSVVEPKGINPVPVKEVVGNITGDSMLERVAVYDRFLAVTGFNYRGGEEFYFKDLELERPTALKRLELRELTGDGRAEIVLVRSSGSPSSGRDYLEVWQFPASDAPPRILIQHEVGIACDAGTVENAVAFERSGKRTNIVVSRGKHRGLKVDQWHEPVAGDETQPALLPWQSVASRSYAFEGDAFKLVGEKEKRPDVKGPSAQGQRLWSGKAPPVAKRSSAGRDPLPSGPRSGALQAPRKPRPDELQGQVYDLYRRERHAKGKPKFDVMINVAADDTPERVLVHGADLVVFGEKFREASSYAYTKLGLKSAEDVLALTAMDVTGDGHAELIVRGVLPAKASKALGGKVVTRHALFVYKVRNHSIQRIFAAETGRSLDGKSVLANVSFRPHGDGIDIVLGPGRALGWTSDSYPFPQDPGPYGGLEALLLPWSGKEPAVYRFAGEVFETVAH